MVVFNSFQGFVHVAEPWVVKTQERIEEVAIWHAAYDLLQHIVCHLLLDRYVVCGERYSTRAGFLDQWSAPRCRVCEVSGRSEDMVGDGTASHTNEYNSSLIGYR